MPDDENRTANDTDCVNLLVIGDIHLRATGERFPVEKLPVADHDVVVSLGDIIDENRDHAKSAEAGDTYEQRGREFFEHLDKQGVPILAVPGNHDPLTCTQRLVDGLENIEIIHRDAVAIPTDTTEKNVTVVGWGCERFDFTPALLTPDYPDVPLNASQPPTPDVVAETVQRTAGRYLTGLDSQSVLAEQLEISDGDQSRFAESLARLEDRFETLVDLIQDAPNPIVVASHVSPFNVPFDCRNKHSHEGQYHFGSLALRLALMETAPVGCISGHIHQQGFTAIETASGYTYTFNPGAPGIASVAVSRSEIFQAEELAVE